MIVAVKNQKLKSKIRYNLYLINFVVLIWYIYWILIVQFFITSMYRFINQQNDELHKNWISVSSQLAIYPDKSRKLYHCRRIKDIRGITHTVCQQKISSIWKCYAFHAPSSILADLFRRETWPTVLMFTFYKVSGIDFQLVFVFFQ